MCVFEGGVRVVRGGAFCGDVVLSTERWCSLLRGSARTYARVCTRTLRMCVQISKHEAATCSIQRRCQAAPTNLLIYRKIGLHPGIPENFHKAHFHYNTLLPVYHHFLYIPVSFCKVL